MEILEELNLIWKKEEKFLNMIGKLAKLCLVLIPNMIL